MEKSAMLENNQYKALIWASRRGMLELDVILKPYLESHYADMSNSEILEFKTFLEEDDPSLYAWLMGFEEPKREYLELTRTIQQFIQDRIG